MSIIPKFLDSALTPIAEEVGNQLSDIVSLAFTPVMMLKSKRDVYLENYIRDLKEKVDKIPEENLAELSVHIVGPALEDIGKYYYNVKHVKEMYANLIASSLDKNKVEMIHPSYLEIIKQMSPLEADLFQKYFIAKIKFNSGDKYNLIMNYNFLCHKKRNVTNNIFDNMSVLGVLPSEFPCHKKRNVTNNTFDNMSVLGVFPSKLPSDELDKFIRQEGIAKIQSCFINLERLRLISIKKLKLSDIDLEYSKKLISLQGGSYKNQIGKIHIETTNWGRDFAAIACDIPIYEQVNSDEI